MWFARERPCDLDEPLLTERQFTYRFVSAVSKPDEFQLCQRVCPPLVFFALYAREPQSRQGHSIGLVNVLPDHHILEDAHILE